MYDIVKKIKHLKVKDCCNFKMNLEHVSWNEIGLTPCAFVNHRVECST